MIDINEIKNSNGKVVYPVTSTNAVYHTDGTNINSRISKVDGIEVGAQVNDIETITVNGGDALPIINKNINIPIDTETYVTEDVFSLALNDKTNVSTTTNINNRLILSETKLSTIANGAEVNVQADWSELDDQSDKYIKNKPVIPSTDGLASIEYVNTQISPTLRINNNVFRGTQLEYDNDPNKNLYYLAIIV